MVKTKDLIFENPPDEKIKLSLISYENEIYVHWTEVAQMFKYNPRVFKNHLIHIKNKNKHFLKIVTYSTNYQVLFDFFNQIIDLSQIDEEDELYLIIYKRLYECSCEMLNESGAKSIRHILNTNKERERERAKKVKKLVNGTHENNRLMSDSSIRLPSASESSDVFSKIGKQLSSINLEEDAPLRNEAFKSSLNTLNIRTYYLQIQLSREPENQDLRNELAKTQTEIEFYESMIKKSKYQDENFS